MVNPTFSFAIFPSLSLSNKDFPSQYTYFGLGFLIINTHLLIILPGLGVKTTLWCRACIQDWKFLSQSPSFLCYIEPLEVLVVWI